MSEKITGLLIDVKKTGGIMVEDFVDELDNIYKMLDVDVIDVATRKIGDRYYDLVVDDEGLLKEGAIPSAFDTDKEPMLVGNILVVNRDDEGNFASLSEYDLLNIGSHLGQISFQEDDTKEIRKAVVLTDVEY